MDEMRRVMAALEGEPGVLRVARGSLGVAPRKQKRRTIKGSVVPPNLMSDN